jgi:2-oxoisovalerate dehydrogenase E2 component (dihydrolipoyl transacylase)
MTSVTMPQLGESVVEGTVVRWLKREGDPVTKYEPLVEVITDKVNSEIPSPEAGVLTQIVVPEGQTVKVGTEIALIESATATRHTPREDVDRPAPPAAAAAAAKGPEQESVTTAAEVRAASAANAGGGRTEGATGTAAAGDEDAPKYAAEALPRRSSPLVRRLAKEHGIDVALVTGTGTGGRVTKEDMLAYVVQREQAAPAVAASAPASPPAQVGVPAVPPLRAPAAAPAPAPGPAVVGAAPQAPASDAGEVVLPVSPIRRAIAEHMVRSVTTAPHAWTYVEVDVSGLVKWRTAARDEFRAREGIDLTYVPFACKALVETLREHPILNSTWRDGQVVLKQRINLGVAVALEDNLVVPVIRDADEKSIAGLAKALHDLVARARANRLTVEDVQGGTFTLNNTGALGSILSMPIINQPQAAILTMEAINKRVVVTADDAIAVRPMLNLCLSFDHRVCDGLPVGRFLQSLKQHLEAMGPGGSIY